MSIAPARSVRINGIGTLDADGAPFCLAGAQCGFAALCRELCRNSGRIQRSTKFATKLATKLMKGDDDEQRMLAGKWFFEHGEVMDDRLGKFSFARHVNVPSGEMVCKIKKPVFGDYFADKFCSLARQVEFDAIIFRDGVFSNPYARSPGSCRNGQSGFVNYTDLGIRLAGLLALPRHGLYLPARRYAGPSGHDCRHALQTYVPDRDL